MADTAHELWCLIEGTTTPTPTPFSIDISPGASIDKLKDMIKEKKKNLFQRVDASDLILWKVRYF